MAADERESERERQSGGDLPDDAGSKSGSSHPVGTGVGVAGGAVAGTVAGMVAGPLGMAVGGVAGAVIGGLTGRAVAEAINPAEEEAHWRERYTQEPYYESGRSFDDYGPAYRYGMESRMQSQSQPGTSSTTSTTSGAPTPSAGAGSAAAEVATGQEDWDTAATRLESGWEGARGPSTLDWERARPASRAAWDRVSESLRGAQVGGSTGGQMGSASTRGDTDSGDDASSGLGAAVGAAQSSGNDSGDREDMVDALNDLVECCKDGEYGFQACAENAHRQDLKSVFEQRAEDCRRGCKELQDQVRQLGGEADDSGSTLGTVHRGWVSIKSSLATYDDKAILEEAERGEDNALARYRKALKKPLPADIRQMVERQLQGVQRNHDQIKMLRDQFRAAT